jgi:hypothetical protein
MVPHGNFVNQGMVIPRKYVKIKKCDTFLILTFIILILSMKVRIQLINYSTALYILQHMLRKYLTVGSKSVLLTFVL